MNNKVAVFGKRQAGVYRLSEIYNPDDVNSSVQNLNKVIPAIGSLVVDDTVGNHNTLYVVYSVDADTHRTTLVPASMTNLTDGASDTVTYGNDLYMLFFNPTATACYYVTTDATRQTGEVYYTKSNGNFYEYTGELVPGTTYYKHRSIYELNVDSRISIFGTTAVTYTLFKTSSLNSVDTATSVVSQFFTDPVSGETYESINIPMETITVPESDNSGNFITCQAKRPMSCYTADIPQDGDKLLLVAFDSTGRSVAQVVLNSHSMTGLEVLNSARHTIVSFTVTANQYDPLDGKIYLVQGQDPEEIEFYPVVTYDDDTTETLAIDNISTFFYHDDYSNAIAGSDDYPLVFKHYLSPVELTTPGGNYTLGETGRFISVTKALKVVASAASSIGKIMPIICYAGNSDGYTILPLVYFSEMGIPVLSRADGSVSGFQGLKYDGLEQSVTLKYYNETLQQDVKQSYRIALAENTITNGVWYWYRDTNDTNRTFFGKSPRPHLLRKHFVPTSDASYQAGKTYYIYNASTGYYTQFSGSVFEAGVTYYEDVSNRFYYNVYSSADSTYTNEADWFLRYYYYATNPPKPYGVTSVLRPTHFLIRKVDLTAWGEGADDTDVIPVATNSAISINDFFSRPLAERYLILNSALEFNNGSRPSTAIIEFLYSEGSGTSSMKYICGVGVDILAED